MTSWSHRGGGERSRGVSASAGFAAPAEASAGWSRSYYVEPAVYPGAVTHALVHIGDEVGTTAARADSIARPPQVDPP